MSASAHRIIVSASAHRIIVSASAHIIAGKPIRVSSGVRHI